MNASEHIRTAERLLEQVHRTADEWASLYLDFPDPPLRTLWATAALAHAQIATALKTQPPPRGGW